MKAPENWIFFQEKIEEALRIIEEVATNNMGALCVTEGYRLLPTPVIPARFDTAKQKAELASNLLVELGLIARHNGQAHSQLHSEFFIGAA